MLHANPQPEHNKKCIDVPVKYAETPLTNLIQDACGHQRNITKAVSGNAIKALKRCLSCHPMERRTCRAEEG